MKQAQGAGLSSKLVQNADNPFNDFFREVSKSIHVIAERLQLRLNEADIHVDKYIDQLKEKIDLTEGTIQESLSKVSFYYSNAVNQ